MCVCVCVCVCTHIRTYEVCVEIYVKVHGSAFIMKDMAMDFRLTQLDLARETPPPYPGRGHSRHIPLK